MASILVATDGSDGSNRAIDYAADRAKRDGCELVIVNIVAGHGLPETLFAHFTEPQSAWFRELLKSISVEILSKARDRARSAGAGSIELESRDGDVAQAIIEVARQKGVDAVIVGKRGIGRAQGLLLGSVSQKLVSLAEFPVTVVP